MKKMPPQVTKKFSTTYESRQNNKIFNDMLKRFTEKSQTYEFMIKFRNNIEKTDESTISLFGNAPGEIVDQKERRRYLRQEIKKAFQREQDDEGNDLFTNFDAMNQAYDNDKKLFKCMIDLFSKSNQLLNIMY